MSPDKPRSTKPLLVFLVLLAVVMAVLFWQFQPPSLDPEAEAFRQDLLRLFTDNDQALVHLAKSDNRQAADHAVSKLVAAHDRDGSKLIFGMALLDHQGEMIAASVPISNKQLTTYLSMLRSNALRTPKVVSEALDRKKRTSARLYLQNGMKLLVVCNPLFDGGKVVGAVLVGFSADWCQERRKVSPEDFLKIDFNR